MLAAVSDVAWLQAMLDVEAALARAQARLGLIPAKAAEAIASRCRAEHFDIDQLGRDAIDAGSPVVPLVKALRAALPREAADRAHWGATSQDILDTAMMLIARRALDLIGEDLDRLASRAAELAARHRSTIMPARTLLQQAVPTTFGLKAAGWLVTIQAARSRLTAARGTLAVQLAGAAGTMAAFGDRGDEVVHELAGELGLGEPFFPWHTERGRVVQLGMALGLISGSVGKMAFDVVLMAQTEVGEVSEASAGRGGSSSMPQKQNPVGAVAVLACLRGVNAQVGLLLDTLVQEHERAAGAWQAEWPAVSEALRLTGGAVARGGEMLAGLEVHPDRMRENLALSRGLIMSEHVVVVLAERIGLKRARELVEAAAATASRTGLEFKDVLRHDPAISEQLKPADIDAALDPATYLGLAEAMVDRALAAYRAEGRTSR
jgi:3-carboxy-cis,cis-muconate cycloisomerase